MLLTVLLPRSMKTAPYFSLRWLFPPCNDATFCFTILYTGDNSGKTIINHRSGPFVDCLYHFRCPKLYMFKYHCHGKQPHTNESSIHWNPNWNDLHWAATAFHVRSCPLMENLTSSIRRDVCTIPWRGWTRWNQHYAILHSMYTSSQGFRCHSLARDLHVNSAPTSDGNSSHGQRELLPMHCSPPLFLSCNAVYDTLARSKPNQKLVPLPHKEDHETVQFLFLPIEKHPHWP